METAWGRAAIQHSKFIIHHFFLCRWVTLGACDPQSDDRGPRTNSAIFVCAISERGEKRTSWVNATAFYTAANSTDFRMRLRRTFISMKSPLGKRAKTAIFAAL